jgi:hypothetical protein
MWASRKVVFVLHCNESPLAEPTLAGRCDVDQMFVSLHRVCTY